MAQLASILILLIAATCLHTQLLPLDISTRILLASDTLQQLYHVTNCVYKYRRPCLPCNINQSSGLAPRPGAKLVTMADTVLCDGHNSFTRWTYIDTLRCYDLKYAANGAGGTGHCKHCSTSFESIYRSSRMVCLLLWLL